MNQDKLVSVIVCNHNYSRYLRSAIDSIINQTYKNIELIVVDDGSSDDSVELIKSYENNFIKIFKQNEGQCSAYNAGYSVAKGEYICFLDSDDYYDKEAIEECVKKINVNDAKVHFKMGFVDDDGNALNGSTPYFLASGSVGIGLQKYGLLYSSAPGSGNFYKKKAIDYLFPLPKRNDDLHGADFYTIYGSAINGSVSSIDKILGFYRIQNINNERNKIIFGNAAKNFDPAKRYHGRIKSIREHIFNKTFGEIVLPSYLYSFSSEKMLFINYLMSEKNYLKGVFTSFKRLGNLCVALGRSSEINPVRKTLIFIYLFAMIFQPLYIKRSMAQYIGNAASRGN
jgi:glycosyltransferase involved in cell wall biosynthesis